MRREQLAKQKDSDFFDEFEDDEVEDPSIVKKRNKLTEELELLSSASGKVCDNSSPSFNSICTFAEYDHMNELPLHVLQMKFI